MKKMYKYKKPTKTTLNVNQSVEGETIEAKMRRVVNNKEPISDGAPIIYTERKDGVEPALDPRTDMREIALTAMDKVAGSHRDKREARIVNMKKKNEPDQSPADNLTETKDKGKP